MKTSLSLKLFLGFSSIADSISGEYHDRPLVSADEAQEQDWLALCQDGRIVQQDLGAAWRRATSGIDGNLAKGQTSQSGSFQPAG